MAMGSSGCSRYDSDLPTTAFELDEVLIRCEGRVMVDHSRLINAASSLAIEKSMRGIKECSLTLDFSKMSLDMQSGRTSITGSISPVLKFNVIKIVALYRPSAREEKEDEDVEGLSNNTLKSNTIAFSFGSNDTICR